MALICKLNGSTEPSYPQLHQLNRMQRCAKIRTPHKAFFFTFSISYLWITPWNVEHYWKVEWKTWLAHNALRKLKRKFYLEDFLSASPGPIADVPLSSFSQSTMNHTLSKANHHSRGSSLKYMHSFSASAELSPTYAPSPPSLYFKTNSFFGLLHRQCQDPRGKTTLILF